MTTIERRGVQQTKLAEVVEKIADKEGVTYKFTDSIEDVLQRIAQKVGVAVTHDEPDDRLYALVLEHYALPPESEPVV